jgi:hypothetical protein
VVATSRSPRAGQKARRSSAARAPARARSSSCCRALRRRDGACCSTARRPHLPLASCAARRFVRRIRSSSRAASATTSPSASTTRTRRRSARAAEVAGVADDIEAFPHGYDTIVGERGITLSGGQKQRLTLAPRDRRGAARPRARRRAVERRHAHRARHPARPARGDGGRTSIVIAHRISTVIDADRIAVIDDGRIVELGDHADCSRSDGIYAELFRQQQLEEEIEAL